jgi:hypothetical protein
MENKMIKHKVITFQNDTEYQEWCLSTTHESHPIVDVVFHSEEQGEGLVTVCFTVKEKAKPNLSKQWKKLQKRDDVISNKISIEFVDVNNKETSEVQVFIANKLIETCTSYLKAVRLVNKMCKHSLVHGFRSMINKYYHQF